MKIKLDENLPESLVAALVSLGHDTDNVRLEGLCGQDDSRVWLAAQREERFLITQDLNFSDLRQFKPGTHHGLMLVRLRAPGSKALAERITTAFRSGNTEIWTRSFVVLTDAKLRVLQPPE